MASTVASSGHDESKKKLKLYAFWRSSCSGRVITALNLKGLEYEYIAVHLLKGEQFTPEFLKLNPVGYVPVLVDGDVVVADSFAILMYLEEKYPQHPLLPQDLQKRALNIQAANIVCSGIQPLQNIGVMVERYTGEELGSDQALAFTQNLIAKHFEALEKLLKDCAGKYATGDEVYLADLYLAPQIHAAINRFNVDMNKFPILSRLYEAHLALPAFQAGLPENQPDAPNDASGN